MISSTRRHWGKMTKRYVILSQTWPFVLPFSPTLRCHPWVPFPPEWELHTATIVFVEMPISGPVLYLESALRAAIFPTFSSVDVKPKRRRWKHQDRLKILLQSEYPTLYIMFHQAQHRLLSHRDTSTSLLDRQCRRKSRASMTAFTSVDVNTVRW